MSRTLPSTVLDTPYPDQPIPSSLDTVIGLTDWLNPNEYLRKAIEFVFQYNPGEVAGQWLAGDWRGISTVASALDQVAEFMEAYGAYVAGVDDHVQFYWKGRAAELANHHYRTDALVFDADAQVLRDLSGKFDAIAIEMHETAELIGDLLHELEDFLIGMGIKLIAAGITSESVIGALLFGAWAISDAARAVKRFNEIKDTYDKGARIVRTSLATLPGLLSGDANADGFVLPEAHWAPPRIQVPDTDPRVKKHHP